MHFKGFIYLFLLQNSSNLVSQIQWPLAVGMHWEHCRSASDLISKVKRSKASGDKSGDLLQN